MNTTIAIKVWHWARQYFSSLNPVKELLKLGFELVEAKHNKITISSF
jgi:hypothetical protein